MKIPLFLSLIILPIVCLSQDITIRKDTTVNSTWIIPTTAIVRFENNARILGKGTIQGGIIDAALVQHIFDTGLTVRPASLYNGIFSCAWFGAKIYPDAFTSIQKSINVCIENGFRNCYLPKGIYNISRSLKMAFIYKGEYSGVSIHFYGESDMWNESTVINYTPNSGFAVGIQVGKGSEISNLTVKGNFKAPVTSGADYYNTPLTSFGPDGLTGIVIDYDGTKNTSGSTAVRIHDTKVSGFTVLYSVSPNGSTFNADILSFENIQCAEGRIGFQSGQAQEKGNSITNIASWGKLHTLISIGNAGKQQAGDYTINIGNVAGACIRLFDIRQSGWYSTRISNIFSESIASIGNLSTGDTKNLPPLSISGCTFHFALISSCGIQTLGTTNSHAISFKDCIFRYYGSTDGMKFSGIATYQNCFFSGLVNGVLQETPIAFLAPQLK